MTPGPLQTGPARKMVRNAPKINPGDQFECHFVTFSVPPSKLKSKIRTRPLLRQTYIRLVQLKLVACLRLEHLGSHAGSWMVPNDMRPYGLGPSVAPNLMICLWPYEFIWFEVIDAQNVISCKLVFLVFGAAGPPRPQQNDDFRPNLAPRPR